jgi:hypothetical protein
MPHIDYNRYSILVNTNGSSETMPFIKLPENSTDKYEYWGQFSRMDKLSQKYYGNPFYDFLILYGNPQYLSEFDIEDGALIRIPFPHNKVISDYETIILTYKTK